MLHMLRSMTRKHTINTDKKKEFITVRLPFSLVSLKTTVCFMILEFRKLNHQTSRTVNSAAAQTII